MLINGQEYSYVDLRFSMLGNYNVAGVNAIEWRATQAKANVAGAGAEPVARTRAGKEYSGSITIQPKEFFRLIQQNAFQDLTSIPPFNLTISFGNGVDPVRTVTLPYCEFLESGLGGSRGDTDLETAIPIIFARPDYQ